MPLASNASVPASMTTAPFISITRTGTSCPSSTRSIEYRQTQMQLPWTCSELEGPFPFSLTEMCWPLLSTHSAQSSIPIFAISTFDTDYVLVKEELRGQR